MPSRSSNATLTVNILRNQAPPVFISEPYSRTIDRNTGVDTSILTVTATDNDIQVMLL